VPSPAAVVYGVQAEKRYETNQCYDCESLPVIKTQGDQSGDDASEHREDRDLACVKGPIVNRWTKAILIVAHSDEVFAAEAEQEGA
jgi:hypothetical protein